MTYKEFETLVAKMIAEEAAVGKSKGTEYTQGEDRLDNFKRLAKDIGITPKQVLWVFLKKHLDSISTYIRKEADISPQNLTEPIEGRVMDARVYLSLLRGLIEEDKCQK